MSERGDPIPTRSVSEELDASAQGWDDVVAPRLRFGLGGDGDRDWTEWDVTDGGTRVVKSDGAAAVADQLSVRVTENNLPDAGVNVLSHERNQSRFNPAV